MRCQGRRRGPSVCAPLAGGRLARCDDPAAVMVRAAKRAMAKIKSSDDITVYKHKSACLGVSFR